MSATVHDEQLRRQALARAVAPVLPRMHTPALVIDLDAVEHNVAAMIGRAGDAARWRPHVKTIKQPTLVGLLLDAGVLRFKASTPAEVAMVLEAAADRALPRPVDVLLAYPAAPPQLAAMLQLRRAHPDAHLGLLADDPQHAAAIVETIGHPESMLAFELWLDIDVGMHRTGSPPDAWRNAPVANSPWVRPMGLHGYDGHVGWSDRARSFAGYDALVALVADVPFEVEQIVTSGTHSYGHGLAHAPLAAGKWSHQVSPGTLVLSDRRSAPAAADLGLRQAAFVASRVIARPGADRITADAGSKALAPDCPAPACAVLGEPEWTPLTPSEEHRPIRIDAGERPPRGELLWLVPDHVCTTVNMHAQALYVRTEALVGSAPVRARGHRPWIDKWGPTVGAVGLALALPGLGGCQPITTDIDVQLRLPPDDTFLQRTNNVSVVLEPDGFSETVTADGLDFALSFEVPPDNTARTLSVFLADDDTLLAWGGTPRFSYRGVTGGLALLLAAPGALTPLDLGFAEPDALALVAPVTGLGVLVLSQDGAAVVLDAYQYTLTAAATLDDPPDATDGVLLTASDGGIVRVAWATGVAAWRFDPGADSWTAVPLTGDLSARPDAAAWFEPTTQALWIAGGGDALDVVAVPLRSADPPEVTAVPGLALDAPRPQAQAIALGEQLVVVGTQDPTLPVAWRTDTQQGAHDGQTWTSPACASLTADPPQVLCVGGQVDGADTPDGLRLTLDGDAVAVERLPALLPAAIGHPQLFEDEGALYVEGGGQWVRIARDDLAVTEPPGTAPRSVGGVTAALPTGTTLMVGGRDLDDAPLSEWHVFAPNVGL